MTQEALRMAIKYGSFPQGSGIIHALREALAQLEQDNTYTYASSLATTIWQKHYMKESPKFALLDTTEGVLTQIDNMTCGLVREKPAQPEQEPVAWRTFDGEGGYDYRSYEHNESYADDWNKRNPNHSGWVDKLYTHSQPEQEPVGYWKEHAQGMQRDYDLLLADYEKLAQSEQKPVVTKNEKGLTLHVGWDDLPAGTHLFTSPPQRTWVGLTVEEVEKIWQGVEASDFHDCVQPFAQAIENILKDKNCVG